MWQLFIYLFENKKIENYEVMSCKWQSNELKTTTMNQNSN